jgi:hypothetical protein
MLRHLARYPISYIAGAGAGLLVAVLYVGHLASVTT